MTVETEAAPPVMEGFWIAYASRGDTYEPVAYVTSEEAREAVERLLGPILRWWYLEWAGDPW